jgi:putative oxidoreductase
MKGLEMLFACFGRLCMGSLFVFAGIHHILDWHGSVQDLSSGLCRLESMRLDMAPLIDLLLPWSSFAMGAAIFCLLFGGILVFFGCKTRLGAVLLILFIVAAMLIFHPFWIFPMEEQPVQTMTFMLHIAILGGLFSLLAFGNGHPRKTKMKETAK